MLAPFTMNAAVLPITFVGGLMGHYIHPIPIGSSFARFFSLAIAFIVTPRARIRILRWGWKYTSLAKGIAEFLVQGVQPPLNFAHEENFFTTLHRRFR